MPAPENLTTPSLESFDATAQQASERLPVQPSQPAAEAQPVAIVPELSLPGPAAIERPALATTPAPMEQPAALSIPQPVDEQPPAVQLLLQARAARSTLPRHPLTGTMALRESRIHQIGEERNRRASEAAVKGLPKAA